MTSYRSLIPCLTVLTVLFIPLRAPAAEVAELVGDAVVDVRDARTGVRRYRLELKAPATQRLRLTVADVATQSPGPELLAVRADGYVDVFPIPTGPSQEMKRLKAVGLQRADAEERVIGTAVQSSGGSPAALWAALRGSSGDVRVMRYELTPDADTWRGRASKPVKLDARGVATVQVGNVSVRLVQTDAGPRLVSEVFGDDEISAVPLPVSELPPVAVKPAEWKQAYTDGDRCLDLRGLVSALPARDATPTDPEGARGGVLTAGTEPTVVLPLNVALPPGTTGLGLWMTERRDNTVRFVVRDGAQRRYLESGYSEGQIPGPPQFVWVSHQAGVLDWHLRRAHFAAPVGAEAVIESIEIVRRKPAGKLEIGTALATTTADPHRATRVWKLKNLESPKADSTFWTANRYYDYGFESAARLRPPAWRVAMPQVQPHRMRAVARSMAGQPIWSADADGAALEQALELPRLPVGSYQIDLTAFAGDGAVSGACSFIYQVLRDDGGPKAPSPVEPYPWALSGIRFGGASAAVGEVLQARFDLSKFIKADDPATFSWSVRDVEGRLLCEDSAALIAAKPSVDVTLPTVRSGGFTLTVELARGDGQVLDRAQYRYGVSGGSKPPSSQPVRPSTRPLVLSQTKVTEDPEHTQRLPQDSLPALVRWTYEHEMIPSFLVFWRELEPVEGCYNWDAIDRYLAMAEPGQQVAIGVNFSGDNLPEWLWFEELVGQTQQTIHHDYHYASPLGPRLQSAQERLWRAILERYRDDGRVAAWALQAGPSEGFLTDTPPKIADYSDHAVAAFREHLKQRYRSIGELNAAWGSRFPSFDGLRPPVPDFSLPWESSRAWYDFHQFKTGFVPQYLDRLQRITRNADPVRPVYMYAKEGFGSPGLLGPVFGRNRFIYSNGGGESESSFVQASIMRGFDVPVMVEPGQVQADSGTIARLSAYSLLAGGYAGHNLQWGLVWSKKPHEGVEEYEVLGELCRAMARHAGEFSKLRPTVSWAGYYSSLTELLQTRSMRCRLYPGVAGLNNVAQTKLGLPCAWVDDESPADVLKRFPLIVDGGSRILSPESAGRIADYVRQGGVFVCDATAGMHQPANDQPTWHLLKRFGIGVTRGGGAATIDSGEAAGLTLTSAAALDLGGAPQATVLADDPSGRPLVVERPFGRGRIIVVAGEIDRRKSADWLGRLVARFAGEPPYRIIGERVLGGVLRGPDADYVVLHPAVVIDGREIVQASLKEIRQSGQATIRLEGLPPGANCVDLIAGRQVSVSGAAAEITLPRGLLAVVKIERK